MDQTALERALPLLRDGLAEDPDTRNGYLDLISGRDLKSTGPVQDLMRTSAVSRIYERWWRPALGRAVKGVFGPGMADEHRIARLLLGMSPGDGLLD